MGWIEKLATRLYRATPCGKKVQAENRTIHIGNAVPPGVEVTIPEKYPNNRVTSSKYTKWTFLPKNLFEQFHRIANFYFLCVALVEVLIDSPVSPIITILPLIFVVVVTAIKQGYEDWLRHKSDNEVNNRPAHVVRDGRTVTVKAMDIVVGDIVKVTMNQGIPCDMVMLSSENPDGECYITTANLDGETNLKNFNCLMETRHLMSDSAFTTFRGTVECQQPVVDLYKFVGNLTVYADGDSGGVTHSLGPENVLLRGCRLKNTPFIYGCAIYTGQDTKISLNSKYKSSKFSRIERRMNTYLIVYLIALFLYSGIWVGLKYWYYQDDLHSKEAMWYTEPQEELTVLGVIEEFLAFMVLCNYIIPISMYVTVELQKFFGSLFFGWDVEMYDLQTNEPAKALTSDLNEELGQVEYLFTDKTGTLTENDMQFRQCSVFGRRYEEVGGMLCEAADTPGMQPTPILRLTAELTELLTVLAVCHTVRVDKKDLDSTGVYSETGLEYEYQASSPDEKALVEAARNYGIVYHGVRDDRLEVTVGGELHRYRLIHLLDFDPTRKRMSVIVQEQGGRVLMMTKGADTAVLDRVAEGDVAATEQHILDYSRLGLRTLCIACRTLSEEEFQRFDKLLGDARKAMSEREEKLDAAFDTIERDFRLIGATAVEDRLQDGVPETLTALREAGIQVWVLTGDKQETAVNISYSAGHFTRDMTELLLTHMDSAEAAAARLEAFRHTLDDAARLGGPRRHALVIDGRSLAHVLAEDAGRAALQDVCGAVATVLCCRMTPIQKAMVVRLIKQSPSNPTTAAIGDGANDVSMIQEAHVGLGIMGKEGRQAVRSSDYAFGRFRFLQRALLMHGHYFYWRLATLVQYSFYKNVAMITAQLYFTFYSAFTAQSVFDGYFLMFYNITFTFLPILVFGLFELHIRKQELVKYPILYMRIRKNAKLSWIEFLKWNLLGIWHSLVFFFGCYWAFSPGQAPNTDGKMYGVYEHGAIIMTICVIVANIKLMLESYYWNGITFFGFALTFVGYYAMGFLYSAILWTGLSEEFSFYGGFAAILGSGYVWLVQLVLVFIALTPDIVIRVLTDTFTDVYRLKHVKHAKKNYSPDKLSISFTKRSGTLTISQTNILGDD